MSSSNPSSDPLAAKASQDGAGECLATKRTLTHPPSLETRSNTLDQVSQDGCRAATFGRLSWIIPGLSAHEAVTNSGLSTCAHQAHSVLVGGVVVQVTSEGKLQRSVSSMGEMSLSNLNFLQLCPCASLLLQVWR